MANDLSVTVHIDRDLGFSTELPAKVGDTILQLKVVLAAGDPTGETKVEEFSLGLPSGGSGGSAVPLPDSTTLTRDHAVLDLCHCSPPAAAPPAPPQPPEPAAAAPLAPEASDPPGGASTTPAGVALVRDSGRRVWEVVGGADKGGIMVREGKDLKSPQLDERLSTGATVEELELAGERLNYKILTGSGPEEGWVSLKIGSKVLIQLQNTAKKEAENMPDTWTPPSNREESARLIRAAIGSPYHVLGLEPGAGSSSVRRAYHCLALLHHPDKGGDDAIFKAVADAYKALTEAKDQDTGGWRDLEGQAVGPWAAHAKSTKGVTCILFDCFGAPPWESRRIYSGSWQESSVRCWELSNGVPGQVRPPPRLVGEIQVGGFINDIAATSPFGLLTAQSAGMKPLPGESLRGWNLKKTPFKEKQREKRNAIKDAEGSAAIVDGGASDDDEPTGNGGGALALQKGDSSIIDPNEMHIPDSGMLDDMSQMVVLHYRGVRCISLWPRPEHKEATPHLAGTVSKDKIAISKISLDGCSVETPAVWTYPNPHEVTDVNALKHQSLERMWSGDNKGVLKCWDVSGQSPNPCVSEIAGGFGWMTGMDVWPEPGVLVASHSSGMGFIDVKAGKVIRSQSTKNAVGKIAILNGQSPMLFAGIGPELLQYDTRVWRDGIDYKPKAVAQWTLPANITALHCTQTRKGHLLVGVGCLDGKVAAFDTT